MRSQTHYVIFSIPMLPTGTVSHLAIAIGVLGVQNCGLVIRGSNWAVSLDYLQGTETNFPLDLQKWRPMILMGWSHVIPTSLASLSLKHPDITVSLVNSSLMIRE